MNHTIKEAKQVEDDGDHNSVAVVMVVKATREPKRAEKESRYVVGKDQEGEDIIMGNHRDNSLFKLMEKFGGNTRKLKCYVDGYGRTAKMPHGPKLDQEDQRMLDIVLFEQRLHYTNGRKSPRRVYYLALYERMEDYFDPPPPYELDPTDYSELYQLLAKTQTLAGLTDLVTNNGIPMLLEDKKKRLEALPPAQAAVYRIIEHSYKNHKRLQNSRYGYTEEQYIKEMVERISRCVE